MQVHHHNQAAFTNASAAPGLAAQEAGMAAGLQVA
jgi:hypothetical protein